MNNTENTNPPNVDPSDEDYRKLEAIVCKDHEAAVKTELRKWAQIYVGRPSCKCCCERTLAQLAEPCRKPVEYFERLLWADIGWRSMIMEFARDEMMFQAASRPTGMTEQ